MNHQQFEERLFSEEKLSPEQEAAFSQHLETCPPCQELASAWGQVNATFQRSEYVSPAPGFVSRWEKIRETYEYRRRSLRGWLVMGAGAVLVMFFLLAPLATAITSPIDVISEILEGFAGLAAFIGAVLAVGDSIGRLLPQISLSAWLSVINLSIIILVAVWLITIKQFAYKQGV